MLVKCEAKSNRVKGLSFHPKLSWILASLHNGTIQLWDYRIGSLIDKFEEHEGGPVRGVCFHITQPLFVSGGDDYKIKIWNYKLRRCIFTLLGHLDYIRTVEFHDEYPWILSASDDQTIRIWNWQSRSCIAVLTGHNHYVMCAHFHPKEDLVVSGSLDQTVRVWDTSGLRDKTVSIGSMGGGSSAPPSGPNTSNDVFGTSDAVVKYVLEGHERGVNWASFHPTLPLVVSGADDRLIKLWRMNDTKAWEVDTLRGHVNNVSCVIFHSKKELIISNSEDRTIRVWDVTKRTGIHTYRRENDRFWIVVAHRSSNLLAVGHDAGMVVFKLDAERPLAQCSGHVLAQMVDRDIHIIDLDRLPSQGSNFPFHQFGSCRRAPNAMVSGAKSLQFNSYNPSETNVLVFYSQEGGCYDLFVGPSNVNSSLSVSPKQGQATAVAFTARDRFAVLQPGGSIAIFNFQNELSKKFDPPVATDYIYPGGNFRLLLKSEEKVHMYDLTTRKVVEEISVPGGVRYVVWAAGNSYVALFSSHNIILAGKNLEYCHSFHENIRIKSGAWDENGIFIYATLSHVKYCLPNGDSGIIHSLSNPIYIMRVSKQNMYYIDREQQVHRMKLNCSEFLFKLSLHKRNFNDVKMWITEGRLCGNNIIGYLKMKGFPEVALHFVEDQQTRFNLALEYGHIEEATKAAQELDETSCWHRLGLEALRQGNQQIVEMVYQRTKNFEALSFLYFITGDVEKLKKMLKIAVMRQDVMSRFNNALMLGNAEERVKIMAEMGQVPLAALTAYAHNLTDFIPKLEEQCQGVNFRAFVSEKAQLLAPPVPLCRPRPGESSNWPLLSSTAEIFEKKSFEAVAATKSHFEQEFMDVNEEDVNATPGWDAEELDMKDAAANWAQGGEMDIDFDDLDIPDDLPEPEQKSSVNVVMADSCQTKWLKKRRMAGDLVAAGEFEDALQLLQRRLGLINVDPLEPLFMQAYWASCSAVPGLPQVPSLKFPLLKEGSAKVRDIAPLNVFNLGYLLEQTKEGQKFLGAAKFADASASFRSTLQAIPLAVAQDAAEEKQLFELIDVCREYLTFLRVDTAKRALPETEKARSVEMHIYCTNFKLQPAFQLLTLRAAMSAAYKANCFVTASAVATRIVQGHANKAEHVTQARKLLQFIEAKGHSSDEHQLNIDAKASADEFKMDVGEMVPLKVGQPTVQCPYCNSVYSTGFKGKLCNICQLAEVGAKTLGIQFRPV